MYPYLAVYGSLGMIGKSYLPHGLRAHIRIEWSGDGRAILFPLLCIYDQNMMFGAGCSPLFGRKRK